MRTCDGCSTPIDADKIRCPSCHDAGVDQFNPSPDVMSASVWNVNVRHFNYQVGPFSLLFVTARNGDQVTVAPVGLPDQSRVVDVGELIPGIVPKTASGMPVKTDSKGHELCTFIADTWPGQAAYVIAHPGIKDRERTCCGAAGYVTPEIADNCDACGKAGGTVRKCLTDTTGITGTWRHVASADDDWVMDCEPVICDCGRPEYRTEEPFNGVLYCRYCRIKAAERWHAERAEVARNAPSPDPKALAAKYREHAERALDECGHNGKPCIQCRASAKDLAALAELLETQEAFEAEHAPPGASSGFETSGRSVGDMHDGLFPLGAAP